MDLDSLTETIRSKVGEDSRLGAVLKFDCGADGVIVIDAREVPNRVDNRDRDADCTIALPLATLADLMNGALDPVVGFMSGRFQVSGDMAVALKLQRVTG